MDAYQAGDQVFLSYGDECNNLMTWLTYGFCFCRNLQAMHFFDTNDLLNVCALLVPNIFLLPILKLLHEKGNGNALFP